MNRPYQGEDFDDCVDRVSQEERQRELDDRMDMAVRLAAAKRAASGTSIEEHTLLDAYVQGRRAGRDLCSPEMNPHPSGSAKHASWERGRISALGQIAGRNVA